MKILIADDDALQRELLKGFLENQGHLILAASDGHEALKLLKPHRFSWCSWINACPA